MRRRTYRLIVAALFAAFFLFGMSRPVTVYADDEEERREEEEREEEEAREREEREREEREERERELEEEWERDHSGDISISLVKDHIRINGATHADVDIDTDTDKEVWVDWHSDNTRVATVTGGDNENEIVGVSSGTAKITATLYVDGNPISSSSSVITVGRGDRDHDRDKDKHKHRNRDYVYVNGISVNPAVLTVIKGLNAGIYPSVYPSNAAYKAVNYLSSNPFVASVDASGRVYGLNAGFATIAVRTVEGGYTAYVNVAVVDSPQDIASLQAHAQAAAALNAQLQAVAEAQAQAAQAAAAALMASQSRDPGFLYKVSNQVLGASPFGVVNVPSAIPMSYDINVATAMKARPDVALSATFPYDGHMVCMTLPAGFDLTPYLSEGYADWTALLQKPGVTVIKLN
ncbi:MAG TPA: hypothetical protein DCL38_06215 [Lachnospiraceae bacterium]|nr:hypothetical protein [Lachnospiraceae bacterium]